MATEFDKGIEWADVHPKPITQEDYKHHYDEGYKDGSSEGFILGFDFAIEKTCEYLEMKLPLRPDDRDDFIFNFIKEMKDESKR